MWTVLLFVFPILFFVTASAQDINKGMRILLKHDMPSSYDCRNGLDKYPFELPSHSNLHSKVRSCRKVSQ